MKPAKKIVLIFEDNPALGALLSFFFQKQGFKTETFEDGVNAVANVLKHSPALITVDLMMPGRDGIQTCADLRREGISTPILMLAGNMYEADREKALAAGANAYLQKPFQPAALEAAVKPLLAL